MSFQNPVFIPGPTNIPEVLRKACDMPTVDHRSPIFGQILHPVRANVQKVLKSKNAEIFIFPSTGTGGWETALTNTLSAGDTVLAARNGMFSHRWIDLCQRHGLDVQIIECPWGSGAPADKFEAALTADADLGQGQVTRVALGFRGLQAGRDNVRQASLEPGVHAAPNAAKAAVPHGAEPLDQRQRTHPLRAQHVTAALREAGVLATGIEHPLRRQAERIRGPAHAPFIRCPDIQDRALRAGRAAGFGNGDLVRRGIGGLHAAIVDQAACRPYLRDLRPVNFLSRLRLSSCRRVSTFLRPR